MKSFFRIWLIKIICVYVIDLGLQEYNDLAFIILCLWGFFCGVLFFCKIPLCKKTLVFLSESNFTALTYSYVTGIK